LFVVDIIRLDDRANLTGEKQLDIYSIGIRPTLRDEGFLDRCIIAFLRDHMYLYVAGILGPYCLGSKE
jgi:hypothetical protein